MYNITSVHSPVPVLSLLRSVKGGTPECSVSVNSNLTGVANVKDGPLYMVLGCRGCEQEAHVTVIVLDTGCILETFPPWTCIETLVVNV